MSYHKLRDEKSRLNELSNKNHDEHYRHHAIDGKTYYSRHLAIEKKINAVSEKLAKIIYKPGDVVDGPPHRGQAIIVFGRLADSAREEPVYDVLTGRTFEILDVWPASNIKGKAKLTAAHRRMMLARYLVGIALRGRGFGNGWVRDNLGLTSAVIAEFIALPRPRSSDAHGHEVWVRETAKILQRHGR